MTDTRTCEVCGGDRANVEDVTLKPWPASTVAACPVCRYYYDTSRDACLTCGSENAQNYVEVEATIGDIGFPACISGALCDDCAAHVAAEVTQSKQNVPADILVAAEPDCEERDYTEAGG